MTTDALIPQLITQEGYRSAPYKDTLGNWTGGVGHLLAREGQDYDHSYDKYHHQDWLHVLANDVSNSEHYLDEKLPWWRKLSDVRQDVMVCLAFNVPKFVTWHHTISDIESGNFKATAVDLENDFPWAAQVKDRSKLLAETAENDKWPT